MGRDPSLVVVVGTNNFNNTVYNAEDRMIYLPIWDGESFDTALLDSMHFLQGF